jgi:hypothetical protein
MNSLGVLDVFKDRDPALPEPTAEVPNDKEEPEAKVI